MKCALGFINTTLNPKTGNPDSSLLTSAYDMMSVGNVDYGTLTVRTLDIP